MERAEKVARPATPFTVSVPEGGPPDGLAPMLTVTAAVELVRLPNASSRSTSTAGEMGAPASAPDGCVRKASWVGVAEEVRSKAALVADVSPADDACSV